MDFNKEVKDGKLVVFVSGRLDATTFAEFDAEAQSWKGDQSSAIIDLSGLEYISSAGLRSILSAAKLLKGNGGDIAFCGLSGMVEEVFSISGFTAMFTIYPTVDDALSA